MLFMDHIYIIFSELVYDFLNLNSSDKKEQLQDTSYYDAFVSFLSYYMQAPQCCSSN